MVIIIDLVTEESSTTRPRRSFQIGGADIARMMKTNSWLLKLKLQSTKLLAPLTCPACARAISRGQIRIVRTFACPHCHRAVNTSTLYRRLLYASCYGLPTVLVTVIDSSVALRILAWTVLAFLFACLFIVVTVPRLVLGQNDADDSPQRLNLSDRNE
jgi:hypothetical protein